MFGLLVISLPVTVYFVQTQQNTRSRAAFDSLPLGPGGSWTMIFYDEFDGSSLDSTKWHVCYPWDCYSGGNGEQVVYTPNNISVSNGTLKLSAKYGSTSYDGVTRSYSSGLIQTGPQAPQFGGKPATFMMNYGFIEARVKVPQFSSTFPAFWMIGEKHEIDMMEVFGGNSNKFSCGFHLDRYSDHRSCGDFVWGTVYNQFHTFGVDWQPTYIDYYYDGQLIAHFNEPGKLPTDDAMKIILNLAVGANFISEPLPTSPQLLGDMEVDYVRVWAKSSGGTNPSPTPTPIQSSSGCNGDGIYLYSDANLL